MASPSAEPPRLVGIVNITEDSFSDGGRYFEPERAIAQARKLRADGAAIVELGPASSHPDSADVSAAEEQRRLAPVVATLAAESIPIGVDSYLPETQRWCAEQGVEWINDINGFAQPEAWGALAAARGRLIVMHSVQRAGRARRETTEPAAVLAGIEAFFARRLAELEGAGIARSRLVLDPGMGFFLGRAAASSLAVLRAIPDLRARFGLPILISVSRKSFLGELTGRGPRERGPATLAAELFAASHGADYLRTHDVAALRDALAVTAALGG